MTTKQSIRAKTTKPWTAVTMWAAHQKRLEADLSRIFPECQSVPFPIVKLNVGVPAQVSLPWIDHEKYQFDAPHTGRTSHVLFLKFLIYAIKHGGDRLVWVAPELAKTPMMSLFGVVKVLIPAADRKAYSALGDVFPLKCEYEGEKSQKKTLDKNLKQAGMIETENYYTKDVELSFDLSAYEQLKAQYRRADDERREKRRRAALSVSSMAIESLLAAAEPLVSDVVESHFQPDSIVSDVVVQPAVDAVVVPDITASLPSLSEALGWSVDSLAELSQARKRAREANYGQIQATKRVDDAKAELANAEEALQRAAEEHDQANEHLRSVWARLCAE